MKLLFFFIFLSLQPAQAADDRVIKIVALGSETCVAVFGRILPAITSGNVSAATGSLSELRTLMALADLPPVDREVTSNAILKILKSRNDDSLLSKTSQAILKAYGDENALAICVLHGSCKLNSGSSAVHISTGSPYQIKPFFTGERSKVVSHIATGNHGPKAWQGMVLKFKPSDEGLLENIRNFFHESAHYADTLLLADWSKAIQAGAKPHPRLKNLISIDGKSIDEGFIRIFTESRSELNELQATFTFYELMGVPLADLKSAEKDSLGLLRANAMDSIGKYGSIVDGALRELDINSGNVVGRATEMEAWMRSSMGNR